MSQEIQEKALDNFVAAAAALSEAYARMQSDPDDAAKQQAVEDARVILANAARAYQEALPAPRAPSDTEKKDDNPTAEEEALEFDGTRTDQLDDTYRMRIVSASENGKVEHDERGQARWKWATEENSPAPSDTGTFDLLKALDNKALKVSQEVPEDLPCQRASPSRSSIKRPATIPTKR